MPGPGAPRTGRPNKNKVGLLARLKREFPNYHPLVEMARVANDEDADPQMRFNANKEVAKYTTPQLKAVEHSGSIDGHTTVTVKAITDEEWAALAKLEHEVAKSGET